MTQQDRAAVDQLVDQLIDRLAKRIGQEVAKQLEGTAKTKETLRAPTKPGLQLLTVEEAAQRLSVGRSRMYELVESGKVPAKRLSGRRIRISEAELERYIDGLERV